MAEVSVLGLVDGVKVTTSHIMTIAERQTMTGSLHLTQTHGVFIFSLLINVTLVIAGLLKPALARYSWEALG